MCERKDEVKQEEEVETVTPAPEWVEGDDGWQFDGKVVESAEGAEEATQPLLLASPASAAA